MSKQLPKVIFTKWNTDDKDYPWLESVEKIDAIVTKEPELIGTYQLVETQEAKLVTTSRIVSSKKNKQKK